MVNKLKFNVLILTVVLVPIIVNFLFSVFFSISFMAFIWGDSMNPTLQDGDALFIMPDDFSSVDEGDIIAFERDNKIIVHRVIDDYDHNQFITDRYQTQGDNNPEPDPVVTEDDVIGKVITFSGQPIRIPYLGRIATHPLVILSFVGILLLSLGIKRKRY